jgi:dolichol-phosphate mannosyltransferase
VRCLHRPGKLGLSSGVIDGWKFARPESQALGAMDADFSHDMNILPQMVQALETGYGLAVGSRYVKGGGITNWPAKRIVTSKVACMLAQPLTHIKDITSGYFLVRREALEGVELDPIGFKIGLEVIAKAHYGKAIEVPYVFTDRIVGQSKMNQKEIFNYLKQLRKLYAGRLLPKAQKAESKA